MKERNGYKNIVSNIKDIAFAWAGIHANQTDIFINGIKYRIDIIFNSNLKFSNGNETGFGNWVVFKNYNDNNVTVCNKNSLNQLRIDNPLTEHLYCFSDETFGAAIS